MRKPVSSPQKNRGYHCPILRRAGVPLDATDKEINICLECPEKVANVILMGGGQWKMKCPKCKSCRLSSRKKGFPRMECLNCGHEWTLLPDKQREAIPSSFGQPHSEGHPVSVHTGSESC